MDEKAGGKHISTMSNVLVSRNSASLGTSRHLNFLESMLFEIASRRT